MILKRPLLTILIFVSSFFTYNSELNAQIISNESFDNTQFLPTGWTSVGPTNYWTRRTTGTFPTCTMHSGSGFVRWNCHTSQPDTFQTIVSPIIDFSNRGTADAPFSLWVYRDTSLMNNLDSLQILFNTVPNLTGATPLGTIFRCAKIEMPDSFSVSGWHQYTFLAPQGFTADSNFFLLRGYSSVGNGNSIYIDDVSWTSFPNQCDGNQTAGTINSTINTICNGSGTTNLNVTEIQTGFLGLTYQWQTTQDTLAGTWTNIGTGALTQSTGTINQTTYYRIYAGCSFSSSADTSAIYTITVSTNPTPSLTSTPQNPTFCNGATVPTSISLTGADFYTWSPATGIDTTSGPNVLASPTNTTQYTIIGTDSLGCQGSLQLNVQVSNPPTYTMSATPSTICYGDSSRVRASLQGGFGGTTYLWNPGGQTVSNFYDHPTESTIYYVTVTNTAGCSNIDSVTVVVLPPLQTGFTFTNIGGTFSFTNTSVGDTASLWIFGDGNGSFVQNPVYTFNTPGSYDVQLISTSFCGNDTTIQTIVVEIPNGINSVEFSESVKLIPNPANDFVSLSFLAQDSETTLSVLNSIGQIMSITKLNSVNGKMQQEVISIANYPAGIYVVKIDSKDKVAAIRLIVE